MIYLYRFDIIQIDAVATSALPSRSWFNQYGGELLQHTNFEAPVELSNAGIEAMRNPQIPTKAGAANARTYTPLALVHDELRYDSEAQAGELTLTIPSMHQVARVFADDAGGKQVWLTIGVLDSPYNTALETGPKPRIVWTGQATRASFAESQCTLTCTHLFSLMKQQGLVAKHPRDCGHSLFDQRTCKVNPDAVPGRYFAYREDAWLEPAHVTNGGYRLSIPEAANRPAGFFANGFVIVDGFYETNAHQTRAQILGGTGNANTPARIQGGIQRAVATHEGAVLELLAPMPSSFAARKERVRVTIYAGCDGTPKLCADRFNNKAQFGGYPFIPIDQIFDTERKPNSVTTVYR